MYPGVWVAWVALSLLGAALSLLVRRRDREREPGERRAEHLWQKYGTYLAITGGVLYLGSRGPRVFKSVISLAGMGMWGELSRAVAPVGHATTRRLLKGIGGAFIVVGMASLLAIRNLDLTGNSWGWFWLVVGTTDAYSQLFGQAFGAARMVPRLSPGKTWVGFFAGTTAAVLVGVMLTYVLSPGRPFMALVAALATSLAATAGDLLESWMKRVIGIKDFSRLLGHHGGLLDRFDSLLGAAPAFVYLLASYLR